MVFRTYRRPCLFLCGVLNSEILTNVAANSKFDHKAVDSLSVDRGCKETETVEYETFGSTLTCKKHVL